MRLDYKSTSTTCTSTAAPHESTANGLPSSDCLAYCQRNRSPDGRLPSDRRMQTCLKVICGHRVRQHLTARLVWPDDQAHWLRYCWNNVAWTSNAGEVRPGGGVSCDGGRRRGSRAGRNGAHAGRRTDRVGYPWTTFRPSPYATASAVTANGDW